MFGFEMKNQEGDWEYGDITFDPNTNKMSCMGVSIDVDPESSVDGLNPLFDTIRFLQEKLDDILIEKKKE